MVWFFVGLVIGLAILAYFKWDKIVAFFKKEESAVADKIHPPKSSPPTPPAA